jgi:ATP-dependent helicase HrpA
MKADGTKNPPTASRIKELLDRSMLEDKARALRKLRNLNLMGECRKKHLHNRQIDQIAERLEKSVWIKEQRQRRKPRVSYPAGLPISEKAKEIIQAVKDHQVVIISGETGCGKSTQIPKMCLEAGLGIAGKIACTQPRRIAAVSIAQRISEELGESLGHSVGYKIRFKDRTPSKAYIKIMTDGMLLAETKSDSGLHQYDTLIIDEAHERTVNIDFLLGVSKILLKKRPELKLIITSATLDTEKFSRSFQNAPVIQVGGRLFPVDVEYRPPRKKSDDDYVEHAVRAVEMIKRNYPPGDVLVFQPTEQDILETCSALEGRGFSGTAVLPLFARLPGRSQRRVFKVSGQKIVVATNVAETSLTIPGIRYVVDTGLARIPQYQPGTRISSLPVQPISQASADQRKGRCGRVREGLCIRLYSEDDYQSRDRFTPPEIMRSNLSEIILRMIDLNLGHPSRFPFVDPPKPKHIKDGYDTLIELGAVKRESNRTGLTETGRKMARMPLDPRISRILLQAQKEQSLAETAVIASALSIRDPRERPPDKQTQADQMHAPFRHPDSDFLTLYNIWHRYHSDWEKLDSQRKKRRFCREHFLSFSRMREWADVHQQIVTILNEMGIPLDFRSSTRLSKKKTDGIHRAVCSGYLSTIAVHKEKRFYQSARGGTAMLFPGSSLFNTAPPWIVAAEMVRTSRLFARTAARINPVWLEELGGELCRRFYSNPHWDRDRGEVKAGESVTLYGLEIISDRNVSYGRINPKEAHDIFIMSALVEGKVNGKPDFLRHNLSLYNRMAKMEDKLRRRGIVVSESDIFDFYSCRLKGVTNWHSLEKYIKDRGGDEFLKMQEKDLMRTRPNADELQKFPDSLNIGGRRFPTAYKFIPGEKEDGLTLRVPSDRLGEIPQEIIDWGVSGQLQERIAALIKGLPKRYRKQLVPVPDTSRIIAREIKVEEPSIFQTLSRFVRKRFQADIPAKVWEQSRIPLHLKMRIAVTDHTGREIRAGRDLGALKESVSAPAAPDSSPAWDKAREKWEKAELTDWNFGDLPKCFQLGPFLNAYPGLESAEKGVNLRLFRDPEVARRSHLKGVEALLKWQREGDLEFIGKYLRIPEEHHPAALFFGGEKSLIEQMRKTLIRDIFRRDIRKEAEFKAYAYHVDRVLLEKGHFLRDKVIRIIGEFRKTRKMIKGIIDECGPKSPVRSLALEILDDLQSLLPENFLQKVPLDRLDHLPRYVEAMRIRLERGANNLEKDRQKAAQLAGFQRTLDDLQEKASSGELSDKSKEIEDLRWLLEEFKVALFAQELGTEVTVSPKRLLEKIKQISS